ncbi:putative chromate transport protein [Tepidimonas thermarum]|uniref:Putative chromate transport protein n=1 Tax=Tepidimonas thermarum TaxID=335431 RepID=A0A554X7K4_9BURK|nr:chromate transporter [Tepidimonas thermarum]TSE31809.1 putative chromate transport protein [Tepidimonas thermarum]
MSAAANTLGSLTAADWLAVFAHFSSLSLLAIGGAITTAPDMHRYLVTQHGWLTEGQFAASIALAQAAPGPNILFVALMGWHVGLNSAGGPAAGPGAWVSGLLGVGVCLGAMLLPSSLLTYGVARWLHERRAWWPVRAFRQGLAPAVVALLFASGWLMARASGDWRHDGGLWALTAASALIVWRTRVHLLWLLGAGALLGALGWV